MSSSWAWGFSRHVEIHARSSPVSNKNFGVHRWQHHRYRRKQVPSHFVSQTLSCKYHKCNPLLQLFIKYSACTSIQSEIHKYNIDFNVNFIQNCQLHMASGDLGSNFMKVTGNSLCMRLTCTCIFPDVAH